MFSIEQREYGIKNDQVVIVLGGWGTTQRQLWLLGHLLASYNYRAIIFTWDKDILTPDTDLTHKRFIQVQHEMLKTIKSLPKKQRTKLTLFGMSQGTILACMIASTLPQVDKLILNLSGSDLAEITWSWDNVIPGFKDTLREQNITLPKLKKAWLPLSPYHNLKKVTVNNILIYLSAQDELIPFNSAARTSSITAKEKNIYRSNHQRTSRSYGKRSYQFTEVSCLYQLS